MTPNEKAAHLFEQMKGFRVKHSHSKRCAIRAVDEILLIADIMDVCGVEEKSYEYWQEVKKELTK